MTLQTLEYFIAVSLYRNFTKAAQACHVTQPALSRAIRGLEEELGCPLLIRSGRTATLTPEGEVCLTEAERVLQQCEELRARVREAGRQNQQPLRVGYIIQSHLNTFLQSLNVKTLNELPFKMELEYGGNADIKKRFSAGELDIAIIPEACVSDLKGIEIVSIRKSKAYALLYKSHPLYGRKTIKITELKGQPFVFWDEKNLPLQNASYMKMFYDAGYKPDVVGRAEKMGNMMVQVALHNGVGIVSNVTSGGETADFQRVLIEDSPENFGLSCIWRKNDHSPQLVTLKETLAAETEETKL